MMVILTTLILLWTSNVFASGEHKDTGTAMTNLRSKPFMHTDSAQGNGHVITIPKPMSTMVTHTTGKIHHWKNNVKSTLST